MRKKDREINKKVEKKREIEWKKKHGYCLFMWISIEFVCKNVGSKRETKTSRRKKNDVA